MVPSTDKKKGREEVRVGHLWLNAKCWLIILVKSKRMPSKVSGFSATATHARKITSLLAIQLRRRSKAPTAGHTSRVERGGRRWGLTEGLALDLLVGDGAREVEVVHLLLGRLLMGLRRRGGVGGREGGRGPVGRRRRGRGVADGGSHGSSGGGAGC